MSNSHDPKAPVFLKQIMLRNIRVNVFRALYQTNLATALIATVASDLPPESQEPFATLSVNLIDEHLAENEVCIKDYSENKGFAQQLIEQGVISEPIRQVPSGHVIIPICKLLI